MMKISNSTFSNASKEVVCDLYPEQISSYLFRAIALFCIMLISLIGNGLVCYGATRRRRRPFCYHLVTNLAVAELVFTATQPFHFIYNTKPYAWVFGTFMCHVLDPLTLCATLVITFTLATIAVYRCITMLQPHRYHSSARSAYTVIAVSWIWGIVLSLPNSVTRKTVKVVHCDILLCNAETLPGYDMTLFFLNAVIPFLAILISYSAVICSVRKHILQTKQESIQLQTNESLVTRSSITLNDAKQQDQATDNKSNKPFRSGSPAPILTSCADLQSQKLSSSKMIRLETDVLNMMYLIILLFFLCYLPSNTLFILTEGLDLKFIKSWHYYWLMVWYLNLLHTVPSALHPICYGATSRILGCSLFKFCFRSR